MKRLLAIFSVLIFVLVGGINTATADTEKLTPEQKEEMTIVKSIPLEVNKKIPRGTIVTDKTIKSTRDLMEYVIEGHGYVKSTKYGKGKYTIKTYLCNGGHVHYDIYIGLKTSEGDVAVLTAHYTYEKSIEAKK